MVIVRELRQTFVAVPKAVARKVWQAWATVASQKDVKRRDLTGNGAVAQHMAVRLATPAMPHPKVVEPGVKFRRQLERQHAPHLVARRTFGEAV